MNSKQNKKEPYNGKQDSCCDRNETKRKRQHSTQSYESELSFVSQETATTGLSFETDSSISETKMTSDRSVSFCLANENQVIADDPCNDSERRVNQLNNSSHNVHKTNIYKTTGYTNEETGQERMPGHISYYPVNNSRRCSQNNYNEENCRQPLLRRQSTFLRGTINEHPNDSELGSDYAHVQGNFTDSVHPCVCKFHHSQFQKLCSSVKLLKRVVFVLCVFNLILLIALIIVPAFAVLYIQAGKESNPGTGQLPSSSEQQRPESSCVKCEYLMKMFPNFIKTQNAIQSIGDDDGKCCFSDPRKLMTILNQISEESIERAKGSVCISCPSGTSESVITPAVHLKSRGNGLINASEVFVRKRIESTHFVGWQRSVSRDHQGLWGQLNENGASVRVKSPGMYFIYAMIQHKGSNLTTTSGSDNMNTTAFDMPRTPLKVALYICPHGIDGDQGSCSISAISHKYYSSDNGAHQNTYFGRLFYLKENENVYLGISGDAFIHKESESHYLGFYKV